MDVCIFKSCNNIFDKAFYNSKHFYIISSIKIKSMKKLLFTLLLIVCLALSNAQAQCAVYFEEETGIWGAQWDNGKPPYATIDEVKAAAKKSCEGSGGKNCQLFYAGFETGWWVVVLGKARKGNEEGYHLFRVMYFETENTTEAK